jgi:polysaccharide biosynthesis/export protein
VIPYGVILRSATLRGVAARSAFVGSAGSVTILFLLLLVTAARADAQAQAAPAGPADVTAAPLYVLQLGDVLDIKFFYNPELDETVPVRPDGRISLRLVNDVQAAGRSVSDLRAELVKAYGATLREPEVAVIVKEFAARRIYVGGEVNTPSLLRVPGPITLLQALFEAGGIRRSGKTDSIVVLRYQGTTQPQFIKVDLKSALEQGQAGSDIALQASDIVWVPKTKIAKLDDFMDQYVRQLIPIPLTLGVSYVFGGLLP